MEAKDLLLEDCCINQKLHQCKADLHEPIHVIYARDRLKWIDHYIKENQKDIQFLEDDIFKLEKEKEMLNENLNNYLHKK